MAPLVYRPSARIDFVSDSTLTTISTAKTCNAHATHVNVIDQAISSPYPYGSLAVRKQRLRFRKEKTKR